MDFFDKTFGTREEEPMRKDENMRGEEEEDIMRDAITSSQGQSKDKPATSLWLLKKCKSYH
jgi:hypothetical protein